MNVLFAKKKQKKNYDAQRIERTKLHYQYTENSMKILSNLKSLTICLLTYLSQKFRHRPYLTRNLAGMTRISKNITGKKDKNHDQSLRRSKCQRFAVYQTRSCIFCLSVSTSEKLHAVTTTNAERNLN